MTKRTPTILDRIGTLIPGYDGYAKRSEQRQSDKILRTEVSNILNRSQIQVEKMMKDNLKTEGMNVLMEFEELRKACSSVADKILYANYGVSSLFDKEQIKQEELEVIYKFDETLVDRANHIYLMLNQDHEASLVASTVRNHLKEIEQILVGRTTYIQSNGENNGSN